MPEQEEQKNEQEQKQPDKISLTWVLLGMVAIVAMWALSSLLFK